MVETLQPVTTSFDRSLSIEHRSDRLTGDPGVVVLREILERSGIVEWMMPQLRDPRRQEDVVHDLASLIRTSVLLAAQGWRDHDDADALRDDPRNRNRLESAPLARTRAARRRKTDHIRTAHDPRPLQRRGPLLGATMGAHHHAALGRPLTDRRLKDRAQNIAPWRARRRGRKQTPTPAKASRAPQRSP